MHHSSRSSEKPEVSQPQMVQTYHRTPKMNQAIVEPPSVLRDSRGTRCLGNLQHPGNANIILSVKSCFQYFQRVFAYQQHQFSWHHGNSHDCASSVYHDWNEVICLAQYRITSSKLETFLARQRPVLQCQLFECMDKIVHPLLTSNGAIAASVACSCPSELLFN